MNTMKSFLLLILSVLAEDINCQKPFNQAAYRTAKTTITCEYPEKKLKSSVRFFCKDNNFVCEDILSTQSSPKSNGTFSLTETNSGFSISISNVSSQDAGVYRCGVKRNEGNYREAFRKIHLEVRNITNFTRSLTIGQNFSYWCKYENAFSTKFICKGEDPSICELLVTTNINRNKRFSINDDKKKSNITVTLRELTADDAGTYWCGAKRSDNRSNKFFNRLSMTVVPTTRPTTPVVSTPSSASTQSHVYLTGQPQVITIVSVCVAVLLLLLFVLILILFYKRFSRSKNTNNGSAAQQIREDYVYEEIQERIQKPDSENAMMTIYSTANFPMNPSDSLCYSNIKFQKSSDKPGGEALVPKPSSTACEYATVNYTVSPNYSTVSQPSRSTDPLYSTVNTTQQQ